ncbi:unnamed protein product [Calypogeia fissa]
MFNVEEGELLGLEIEDHRCPKRSFSFIASFGMWIAWFEISAFLIVRRRDRLEDEAIKGGTLIPFREGVSWEESIACWSTAVCCLERLRTFILLAADCETN